VVQPEWEGELDGLPGAELRSEGLGEEHSVCGVLCEGLFDDLSL
jgi:hypothetical protein